LLYHFHVTQTGNKLKISKKHKNIDIANALIYINNQYIGSMSFMETYVFDLKIFRPTFLSIQAVVNYNGQMYKINETYNLSASQQRLSLRDRNYKPGDILIGCDNLNGLPYGYMGHVALVVDEEMVIEAVMTNPIIRKVPIKRFIENHPNHAHYRPISKEIGEKAADYAFAYLKKFEENKKNDISSPIFYFTIQTPLTDEWTYIYCSKLIWLSYYYGANYEFSNDHLWFAPEDLYANLVNNKDFELVYKHPNFIFYINI
jgi:uncharacterized protein YycO